MQIEPDGSMLYVRYLLAAYDGVIQIDYGYDPGPRGINSARVEPRFSSIAQSHSILDLGPGLFKLHSKGGIWTSERLLKGHGQYRERWSVDR